MAIGDLIGKKFGKLTILEEFTKNKKTYCICECDCDNKTIKEVRKDGILNHTIVSCGCKRNHKYNTYNLTNDYGIGYTEKGEEFYFDLEDYDKIKTRYWHFKEKYIRSSKRKEEKILKNIPKEVLLHKFILNCYYNDDSRIIDHINRNPLDNRKKNLRFCTAQENSRNKKMRIDNKSGIIGVSVREDIQSKPYFATISINKKQKKLGNFLNKEDAIKARLQAEKEYYGEFAPQRHLFKEYGIER